MKKTCILAGNASQEILTSLKKMDLELIKTKKCLDLYDSISYHPDIHICPVDKKTVVVASNLFDYYRPLLEKRGIKVVKGSTSLGDAYPENIAYNVGIIGNYAFHNKKYTDLILQEELKKRNIKMIDIKQGYSKCSMAIIDSSRLITADKIIYKKSKELELDCLLIEAGNIYLEGQNYGFIGGSSGSCDDSFFLTGHLNYHPDKKKIEKFLKKSKKTIRYLSEKPIEDLGTIFIIWNKTW